MWGVTWHDYIYIQIIPVVSFRKTQTRQPSGIPTSTWWLRYIRKAHPFNASVVRWYERTYVWAKGFWKTQMCDLDDVQGTVLPLAHLRIWLSGEKLDLLPLMIFHCCCTFPKQKGAEAKSTKLFEKQKKTPTCWRCRLKLPISPPSVLLELPLLVLLPRWWHRCIITKQPSKQHQLQKVNKFGGTKALLDSLSLSDSSSLSRLEKGKGKQIQSWYNGHDNNDTVYI